MKVIRIGNDEAYRINYKDVVLLLDKLVVKSLKIRYFYCIANAYCLMSY